MHIVEVAYSMKRSNGNYGSDEVSYAATVAPDENPEHAVAKLKLLCEQQLHGEEWRQGYVKALDTIRVAERDSPTYLAAKQAAANYEAWANAVGDVRREILT